MSRNILFLPAILLTLSLFIAGNVLALGITPGRTIFEYEPGAEKSVSFNVVNSEKKDIDLIVLITGGMNESISVSEVSFSMSASEESKTLSYKVKMPGNLSPGLHKSEVVVIQLPGKSKTSEAFIGAAVGVATQIHVNVPFPGKYAEASLNVIGPEDDGKVVFVIPVINRGDLGLARIRGTIDVLSSLNEKIETLTTDEISLESKKSGEIVSTWDSTKVSPGRYIAKASVLYDEDVLTIEKVFSVGRRLLEIAGIEVNDFFLGEIAKFEILVENKWSEPILGAYAEMLIFNKDNDIMAEFKSATQDIDPLTKALVVAFWDTAGVSKGTYDSSLFLKYGSQSDQHDLKLEVKDNEINVIGVGYVISSAKGSGSGGNLTVILAVAIAVLVIINLLWFLVLRKKLKGSGKK